MQRKEDKFSSELLTEDAETQAQKKLLEIQAAVKEEVKNKEIEKPSDDKKLFIKNLRVKIEELISLWEKIARSYRDFNREQSAKKAMDKVTTVKQLRTALDEIREQKDKAYINQEYQDMPKPIKEQKKPEENAYESIPQVLKGMGLTATPKVENKEGYITVPKFLEGTGEKVEIKQPEPEQKIVIGSKNPNLKETRDSIRQLIEEMKLFFVPTMLASKKPNELANFQAKIMQAAENLKEFKEKDITEARNTFINSAKVLQTKIEQRAQIRDGNYGALPEAKVAQLGQVEEEKRPERVAGRGIQKEELIEPTKQYGGLPQSKPVSPKPVRKEESSPYTSVPTSQQQRQFKPQLPGKPSTESTKPESLKTPDSPKNPKK